MGCVLYWGEEYGERLRAFGRGAGNIAIVFWSKTKLFKKSTIKTAKRAEAALFSNFRNFQFGLPQQAACFMDAKRIDILTKVDFKLFTKDVR